MKKLLIVFCLATTALALQTHAAPLACSESKLEIARCNLVEFQYEGEKPGHSPFPVEAILCGAPKQSKQVEFTYRVSDLSPLTQIFVKKQNHYESADPSENIRMNVDKANSHVKIIEVLNGKPITTLFSCILW